MIGFWPNLVSSMYRGVATKVLLGLGVWGPLGPRGSKMLKNALWLPNLVRRTTDASLTWWWPSLRSKVIRGQMWQTTCYGYQTWSEESLKQAYDDDDLHGGQRSSEVKCDKLCSMATKLGQKDPWCKFMMMMTCLEVIGHQRSNVINYVLWLPNLVRRIPDASLWWWWPSWRSKVIRGQR